MRSRALLLFCAAATSLACGRAIAVDPAAERPARNPIDLEARSEHAELGVAAPAVPSDEEPAAVLARTPFVSVEALCETQMRAAAPRIRQAQAELRDRGGPLGRSPACAEDRGAMKSVKLDMRAPYFDATAITYEDGYGMATDLAVRAADGWLLAPVQLAYDGYLDPGCPSIVRARGLAEVRVQGGEGGAPAQLVVVTDSDRGWDGERGFGAMIFTSVRACRAAAGRLGCGAEQIVAARHELFDYDTRKPLPVKQRFATTYTVDDKGAVHPARRFDMESL
jgi:hypothetical protein